MELLTRSALGAGISPCKYVFDEMTTVSHFVGIIIVNTDEMRVSVLAAVAETKLSMSSLEKSVVGSANDNVDTDCEELSQHLGANAPMATSSGLLTTFPLSEFVTICSDDNGIVEADDWGKSTDGCAVGSIH